MKALIYLAALMISLPAFATNYVPVPDGTYSGSGTWTDNLGNSGTWTLYDKVTLNGGHHLFKATFSDGQTYNGDVDVIFSVNSHYAMIADVDCKRVTVGQGVSAPTAYQNTVALSKVEAITEIGRFANGEWQRDGSIVNSQTGYTRFVTIKLN